MIPAHPGTSLVAQREDGSQYRLEILAWDSDGSAMILDEAGLVRLNDLPQIDVVRIETPREDDGRIVSVVPTPGWHVLYRIKGIQPVPLHAWGVTADGGVVPLVLNMGELTPPPIGVAKVLPPQDDTE